MEPDKSEVSFELLDYGAISSIFKMDKYNDIVFKRLPFFPDKKSAELYRDQYFEYTSHLQKVGINIPEDDVLITHAQDCPYVLYFVQRLFSSDTLCSKLIHTSDKAQITEMVEAIIHAVNKVRRYNEQFMPGFEIAVDAQLSNWTWPVENGERKLYLIDTSTPLYRIDGNEQLDVKLLLKSVPFIIRIFVNLEDVAARYYDFRTLFLDIIGNLIKEQAPELIPLFIDIVNKNIEDDFGVKPVSKKDVESYYKKDRMIWKIFLALRKMGRFVTAKMLGKRYEFILPEKVKR